MAALGVTCKGCVFVEQMEAHYGLHVDLNFVSSSFAGSGLGLRLWFSCTRSLWHGWCCQR